MNLNDAEIHCLEFIKLFSSNGRRSGMRYSKRGVPHVLVWKDNCWHSITYFCKEKNFRVFWPYKSNPQNKRDFKSFNETVAFINGWKDEHRSKG